jgi:ELWxxDGT repeat protein
MQTIAFVPLLLWAQGLIRVLDINPLGDSTIADRVGVGGMLYFSANDGSTGVELWRSGGTEPSTSLIDLEPGSLSSYPGALVEWNGELFFAASSTAYGNELMRGNGGAPVLVKDIRVGSGGSGPSQFTPFDGDLFFSAWDGTLDTDFTQTIQLWRTDGSSLGTTLVKTFYDVAVTPVLGNFVVHEGKLLVVAAGSGQNRHQIWSSDGTPGGTTFIFDGLTPPSVFLAGKFTSFQGQLYFPCQAGAYGWELWRSDGTSLGTQLFKDQRPGTDSSYPNNLTPHGNTLYYTGMINNFDTTLMRTMGTPETTQEALPGLMIRNPAYLAVKGPHLYFYAQGNLGQGLYRTDGSEVGTELLHLFLGMKYLVPVQDLLYFIAEDTPHGVEMWRSDGSAAGTEIVVDFTTGSASSFMLNSNVTNDKPLLVGSYLYTSPTVADPELYRLDASFPTLYDWVALWPTVNVLQLIETFLMP